MSAKSTLQSTRKICTSCHRRDTCTPKAQWCKLCNAINARWKLWRVDIGCAKYKSPDFRCHDCREVFDPRSFFFYHRASGFYTNRCKTFRAFAKAIAPQLRRYLDACDMLCENCAEERRKPSKDFKWACPNCLQAGSSKRAMGYDICRNCKNAKYWRDRSEHAQRQAVEAGLPRYHRDVCDSWGIPYFI